MTHPGWTITPSAHPKIKGIYVSSDPRVDIKFEVFHEGKCLPVDRGIIQSDSRYLAWSASIFRGVSKWRLAESTITNPTFQMLCYQALTIQQQDAAMDRKAMTDDDRNEKSHVWGSSIFDPPVRNRRGLV